MRKWLIASALLVSVCAGAQEFSVKQQEFVDKLLPAIMEANNQLYTERTTLNMAYQQWLHTQHITRPQQTWLLDIANKYNVQVHDFSTLDEWQTLLRRVDELPPSLVLAQAINESAWGNSRFAKEGNNYFGKWCFRKGCGIIPKKRGPNAKNQVKKYDTILASVQDYMYNLNTNDAYLELRMLRQQAHQSQQAPRGMDLVDGLKKYSSRGEAYVDSLKSIINTYQLAQFDHNSGA